MLAAVYFVIVLHLFAKLIEGTVNLLNIARFYDSLSGGHCSNVA